MVSIYRHPNGDLFRQFGTAVALNPRTFITVSHNFFLHQRDLENAATEVFNVPLTVLQADLHDGVNWHAVRLSSLGFFEKFAVHPYDAFLDISVFETETDVAFDSFVRLPVPESIGFPMGLAGYLFEPVRLETSIGEYAGGYEQYSLLLLSTAHSRDGMSGGAVGQNGHLIGINIGKSGGSNQLQLSIVPSTHLLDLLSLNLSSVTS